MLHLVGGDPARRFVSPLVGNTILPMDELKNTTNPAEEELSITTFPGGSCSIYSSTDNKAIFLNQYEFETLEYLCKLWPERWLIFAQSKGQLTCKLQVGRFVIDYQKEGVLLKCEEDEEGIFLKFVEFDIFRKLIVENMVDVSK